MNHGFLHVTASALFGFGLLAFHVKPVPVLLSVVALGVVKEVYDGPRESMSRHVRGILQTTAGGTLALTIHATFR